MRAADPVHNVELRRNSQGHDSVVFAFPYRPDIVDAVRAIPALESAHAIAEAARLAPTLSREQIILVNLSGRGDKDIFTVADELGVTI